MPIRSPIVALVILSALNSFFLPPLSPAMGKDKPPVPDFTKGDQPDKTHDWNLGPTGARGWIYGWHLSTDPARQILITKVDKGSPADGILKPGDVILGVGDQSFNSDARKVFGSAITQAETEKAHGVLKLIRWRNGEQQTVELHLAIMGSYSDTSPYDCPKARKIMEAGCRYIAAHPPKGGIAGNVDMLALLASGDAKYLPLVADYVHKIAKPDLNLGMSKEASGMASWSWSYNNLLLTEYYLATGDKSVLPAIREYSVKIAEGQSFVGTWGHGMAWPDLNGGKLHGSLGGYGAMNQAGLICHLSMVLAEKCGIQDPEIHHAIVNANKFMSFFAGKGSIPYGDHRPGWERMADNGKNSSAAVLFDLQGMRPETQFFSRMVVASYEEREPGHTGNYFSFLWGPLAANRAGPDAVASFLKEQRWFYDMGRKWDGGFPYQGGAGMSGGENKYGNFDCTGEYVLAYALPLKKLYITGRGVDPANALKGEELRQVIEAGRGYTFADKGIGYYRTMPENQQLECLKSWCPAVRFRAAAALEDSQDPQLVQMLMKMLESDNLNTRYGVCMALGNLGDRAAPAVPALTKLLDAKDVWLRSLAVNALNDMGPVARPAVPAILKAALVMDEDHDPRQIFQRYVAKSLFYSGRAYGANGLISKSVEGVNRPDLYKAIEVILRNDDGWTRSITHSVYGNLSFDELKPILPAIVEAIKTPAPSGVMFAGGIRTAGLQLLAKNHITEGIPLCIAVIEPGHWGLAGRANGCLKALQLYGGAARSVLPELEALQKQFSPTGSRADLYELVKQTIEKIKSDENPPKLRSLNDL